MDYVFNPEGYTRFYGKEERYRFYYIRDHLGNVREMYVNPYPNYRECVQRTQYYPSGLPWYHGTGQSEQPFKYSGKEFVEISGLDEYDSGARWYYPAIMRTTTMDPLCEKYFSISPYAWCGNNPVNMIDPDGRKIKFAEGCSIEFIDAFNANRAILKEANIDYTTRYDEQTLIKRRKRYKQQ